MAYVVTEPCVDCKFTDCAAVCPTQAFHEAGDKLYINPGTCIDCDACVAECPVKAIYPADQVPPQWMSFIEENARECEKYPVIVEKIRALKGTRCSNPAAGD